MVIGVIGVVFGSGGILGGCFGACSGLMVGALTNFMPPGQPTGMEILQDPTWKIYTIASSLVTIGVAALLLIGSISLLRRRLSGVKTCRIWAVVKMVVALANAPIGYLFGQAQIEQMEQMSQNMPGGGAGGFGPMAGLMQSIGVAGVVIGVLWGCALPVFLLIWFSRAPIKREIAQWS